MKKLYVLVACLLVLALVLGSFGCAAPAPKGVTKIMISAGRVGDPWYVLSEALAYHINHESDWLRATVVATPGLTGSYELLYNDPLKYIGVGEVCNHFWMPIDPYGKAHNYYDKGRFIATCTSLSYLWATYDKEIKTMQDFAGKTVDVNRKAAANTIDQLVILEAAGVLDKVKLAYSGVGGGAKSIKDGLVDITNMLFDHVYPAGMSKGAFITDMETKGPIYYIGHDPAVMDKLNAEKRLAGFAVRVPPGALGKTQPTELYAHAYPSFWFADERMDEDIVYEVTRVIWESAGKWATWHPQGAHMTETFIPASSIDPKLTHPGAKKYYDEHDVEVVSLVDLLR